MKIQIRGKKGKEHRNMSDGLHRSKTNALQLAMDGICQRSHGEGTTIGGIFAELQERGYLLGLLLLTLPFVSPLPTMGLSAPVGVLAMVSGVALCFSRRPWVPGFISRRQLSHDLITRLASVTTKAADRVNRCIRPRWSFMFWPGLRHGVGIGLVSAGFVLSLPLPIPFSNSIPAVAILLLCLGTLFQDGLTVLLGHSVGIGAWAYLFAVGDVTWSVFNKIISWV
jgi:hypothetical protein